MHAVSIQRDRNSRGLLSLCCHSWRGSSGSRHRFFESIFLPRFAKYFLIVVLVTQIPLILFLWNSVEDEEGHFDVNNNHYQRIKSLSDDIWKRDRKFSVKSQKILAAKSQRLRHKNESKFIKN